MSLQRYLCRLVFGFFTQTDVEFIFFETKVNNTPHWLSGQELAEPLAEPPEPFFQVWNSSCIFRHVKFCILLSSTHSPVCFHADGSVAALLTALHCMSRRCHGDDRAGNGSDSKVSKVVKNSSEAECNKNIWRSDL